jgi:hypothetical protein
MRAPGLRARPSGRILMGAGADLLGQLATARPNGVGHGHPGWRWHIVAPTSHGARVLGSQACCRRRPGPAQLLKLKR